MKIILKSQNSMYRVPFVFWYLKTFYASHLLFITQNITSWLKSQRHTISLNQEALILATVKMYNWMSSSGSKKPGLNP